MKKFLLILIMIFCALPVNAIVLDNTKDGGIQSKVNKIGFRILNSNRIPYRIMFTVNPKKLINAGSYTSSMHIVIYSGIILICDSDDEIAAILSHEIAHSVESYNGIFKGFFMPFKYSLASKKYESLADKTAVDFMVNAGYNPLAMMVIYTKSMPQPRYDCFSSHPLSSKRMMNIYEYIYYKYPAFLANNEYKDNIYYQNFLLTSEQNRKKLQKKVETKSNKRIKYE